jgi:hypothetical protein
MAPPRTAGLRRPSRYVVVRRVGYARGPSRSHDPASDDQPKHSRLNSSRQDHTRDAGCREPRPPRAGWYARVRGSSVAAGAFWCRVAGLFTVPLTARCGRSWTGARPCMRGWQFTSPDRCAATVTTAREVPVYTPSFRFINPLVVSTAFLFPFRPMWGWLSCCDVPRLARVFNC